MTAPRRLLFITNGYGEDSVGAEIVRRLPPTLTADVAALRTGSLPPLAVLTRIGDVLSREATRELAREAAR